jgi:hypothetical protein
MAAQSDGQKLFDTNCAKCHGPDGSGNTTVGKAVGAKDLRSAEAKKLTDADKQREVLLAAGREAKERIVEREFTRVGDTVQVTKIEFEGDRLILQINGGFKGGRHWYQGVQVSGGMGGGGAPVPIATNDSNAPGGTSIAILFHKPMEPIKAAAIKKMLAPVLDFEKHSVTEVYAETLPPEVQKAIRDKRVVEGMNHEQVLMAMGRPEHKSRETNKDGLEVEDWVYGIPPGKITFVTFNGDKVIKVKESYAGLGTIAHDPPK